MALKKDTSNNSIRQSSGRESNLTKIETLREFKSSDAEDYLILGRSNITKI